MAKQLGMFVLHAVILAALVLSFTATKAHGQATIFERRTSSDARRQELLTNFQTYSEDYQEKYRMYGISKAQWQSIGTLASLEEVINSTREVMVARDYVAVTYAEIILDSLEKSTGVEVTQKEMSVNELKEQIKWLNNHRVETEKANTRELVNARADEYTDHNESFVRDTERALAHQYVGRVQTVIDKSNTLYGKILEYYSDHPGDASQQVARQQKFNQVEQRRSQLTGAMAAAVTVASERERSQRNFNASSTINALSNPYALASQYAGYLYELALAAGEQ